MCGISGYLGNKQAAPIILEGLKRLEYRGYDSAGIATIDNYQINIKKDVGSITEIDNKLQFSKLKGTIGIGHTRWATHGEVNQRNAHPHVSQSKNLILVHNGIIENLEELKSKLNGVNLISDTDSEIALYYFENKLKKGLRTKEAIKEFLKEVKGTLAILLLNTKTKEIYAIKRDSPLALGIGTGELFLGSDIYAFSKFTDKAIFFEDNEFAIISDKGFKFFNQNGLEIIKKITKFKWTKEEQKNKNFEHYMLKEIYEEPKCIERLLISLNSDQKNKLQDLRNLILNSEKILFVAAGTSYHAALYGTCLLTRLGFDARAIIASEFSNIGIVNKKTLIIVVSQSGETMDVLDAIKPIKDFCYSLVSIVNVPHSSIERSCFLNFNILAGQEIAVASTKTYINEVYLFLKLAQNLGMKINLDSVVTEIKEVIENNSDQIKKLARLLKNKKDIYILGKGSGYAIAREIALKLKEVAYIHAEGMVAGELKHGTLALVENGTPVIPLISEKNDPIISNLKEAESRKALSIPISPYYGKFKIPESKEKFALYATTIGFLLTYYIAKLKGLSIDKPRNLAKSVTVK